MSTDANVDNQEATDQASSSNVPPSDERSDANTEIPAGFQNRFNEIYGQSKEKDRVISAKDEEIQKLQAKLSGMGNATESELKPPTEADADFDPQKLAEMKMDYKLALQEQKLKSEFEEQYKARQQQEKQQNQLRSYHQKEAAYAAENPGFIERAERNKHIQLSGALKAAILSAEAPEVYDYLLQNPSERSRIESLQPVDQAIEVGKMLVKKTENKNQSISNAPDPINKIRGGAPGDNSPYSASTAKEYAQRRLGESVNSSLFL